MPSTPLRSRFSRSWPIALFIGMGLSAGCGWSETGPGWSEFDGNSEGDTGAGRRLSSTILSSVERAPDGSWVAVGLGWTIDPATWEYRDYPGLILHSLDGRNWGIRRLEDEVIAWDVVHFDGRWLVLMGDSGPGVLETVLLSSQDASDWEAVSTFAGQMTQMEAGTDTLVAAGVNAWVGELVWSADGANWSPANGDLDGSYGKGLVYGDGFVTAAGPMLRHSVDGRAWTSIHLGKDLGFFEDARVELVSWNGTEFVCFVSDSSTDGGNSILRSSNGRDWTSEESSEWLGVEAIQWSGDAWFGVRQSSATSSSILRSEDLLSWTTVFEYDGTWLKDIELGPELWVASGDGIVVSEDWGVTWEVVLQPGVY